MCLPFIQEGGVNMLYPKIKEKSLDKELFQNPTAEYRGKPFWGWNCVLTKEILEKQIDYLKKQNVIICNTDLI